MKRIVPATIVLAMFGWLAPSSYACFCITPDAKGAFEKANAVFVGEVAEIIPSKADTERRSVLDRFDMPPVEWLSTIRFNVVRLLKGTASAEFEILSSPRISRCLPETVTYTLRKGEQYLVYAESCEHFIQDTGARLGLFSCGNRTAPISNSAEDIEVIESMSRWFPFSFDRALSARRGAETHQASRPSFLVNDGCPATDVRY